jgi:hypothetical protein
VSNVDAALMLATDNPMIVIRNAIKDLVIFIRSSHLKRSFRHLLWVTLIGRKSP